MKTILITGGSKGIGFSTAEKCLKEGCRVILLARNLEGLELAKSDLVKKGFEATRIQIQVADMEKIRELSKIIDQLPWVKEGLDGLVNNAAIETLENSETVSIDDMEQMIRVNAIAPIIMIQSCWKALVKNKGSIVNVGSIADQRYHSIYGIYGGTKAFLKCFTKHAAQELGFQGVKINLVSPGGTQTPMMDVVAAKYFKPSDIETTLKTIPMEQRWGTSDEVADAIWFALSGPRYFHGDDIRIHGGIAS